MKYLKIENTCFATKYSFNSFEDPLGSFQDLKFLRYFALTTSYRLWLGNYGAALESFLKLDIFLITGMFFLQKYYGSYYIFLTY